MKAASLKTLPALGQPFPGHPGVYGGLSTTPDGRPYILVRLNAQPPKRQSHQAQLAWAESQGAQLADRVDGALMHATLPDLRPKEWIWLATPGDAYDAWGQDSDGFQGFDDKSALGGGVAVRRLFLESFDPFMGLTERAAGSNAAMRKAAYDLLAACDTADLAIAAAAEAA